METERTIALLPLTNDDAKRIAATVEQPRWLTDLSPRFEMRGDELCAVWKDGLAVYTGEDWRLMYG